MKFKVTRANENNFESGLRGFFAYKNLGIEEANQEERGDEAVESNLKERL